MRIEAFLAAVLILVPVLSQGQAVPRSQAEIAAAGRKADAAGAVGTAMEVKSGLHHVPAIADAYSGKHYTGALSKYGTAVDVVGTAASITEGYYRAGTDGAIAAALEAAPGWITGMSAEAMAAASGHPAAPVVAAGAVGAYVGGKIDEKYGNQIFNAWGPAVDDFYDRNVRQPERDRQNAQLAESLRERHRQAKAQHAAQQAAAYSASVSSPAPAGPSAVDVFLDTLNQVQQQQALLKQQSQPKQASTPAASCAPSASNSGMHGPDCYCPVPHMSGQCPAGARAGVTSTGQPPIPIPNR